MTAGEWMGIAFVYVWLVILGGAATDEALCCDSMSDAQRWGLVALWPLTFVIVLAWAAIKYVLPAIKYVPPALAVLRRGIIQYPLAIWKLLK